MIKAVDISFDYGEHRVLRGLDASIPDGIVTSLMGRNGIGKTTLLRVLAGLLPPRSGTIHRDGAIGYVPQGTSGVFPYTVAEMVLMGRAGRLRPLAQPGRDDRDIARGALDRVGLSALAQRPFSGLSGGQQQLVLIARALATQCDVLVLDEPASALDLRNQSLVLELLIDLASDGMGILLSTHSPEHVLHLGGRCLILTAADELLSGPVDERLTDEVLRRLYDVDVRRHAFRDEDRVREVIVTRYESVREYAL